MLVCLLIRISHTTYVTCDRAWSLRDTSQTLSRFSAPLVLTDFTDSFTAGWGRSHAAKTTRNTNMYYLSSPEFKCWGHRELCARGLSPQGQVHQPREWVFLYAVRRKRKDGSSRGSVCAWALLVSRELCSYQDLISMETPPTLGALTPVSFIQSISTKHRECKQGNYPASAFSLV